MANNIIMNGTGIITTGKSVIINGKEYPYPQNLKGNNVTVINDKIFIDGYELKNGQWKRTLRALFHLIF